MTDFSFLLLCCTVWIRMGHLPDKARWILQKDQPERAITPCLFTSSFKSRHDCQAMRNRPSVLLSNYFVTRMAYTYPVKTLKIIYWGHCKELKCHFSLFVLLLLFVNNDHVLIVLWPMAALYWSLQGLLLVDGWAWRKQGNRSCFLYHIFFSMSVSAELIY